MAGPHTQPREVAVMKGALKTHPDRYRNAVPKNKRPFGHPPKHLPDAAKAIWFEFEEYSLPGVLTAAERPTFELLCLLFAEFREDPRKFPAPKLNTIVGCLGRLGMTPADRQKIVVVEDEDKEKPHQEFAQ